MVTRKHSTQIIMITVLLVVVMSISMLTVGAARRRVTIRFVAANHPFTDVIKPLIPEFEKETGIRVDVENYEENQLTQKLTVEFTSGASTVDVFMTRPLQEGRLFYRNKWYHNLNQYLSAPGWDWADYPKSTVEAVTLNEDIYAIPIVTEWKTLFYRKDLFAKAGLKVPTTFEELEEAARRLHDPANDMYGIVLRGQRGAAVTQFSSFLYSHGGDFIKDGKCVIDSPEAVEAFKYYGRLLHDYGPPGVTNMSWPQAQALFASGKVAMWADASVLIAGIIDAEKSVVADQVGVAIFPAGPAGAKPFQVVPWSVAIAAQSRQKEAALEFLKWATSKTMAKTAQLGGLTMARNSVWNDPEIAKHIYPGLAESARLTGPIAVPYDRPLMTAVTEARDAIGEVIVTAIESGGKADLASLAKSAAAKVDVLLARAGEGPSK